MTHKAMKFRVKNTEHSKAIQERLFEIGYTNGIKNTQQITFAFIYANETGMVGFGNDILSFSESNHTETTLEEITEWTPKQGEMIEVQETIGGKWIKMEFAIKFQDLYLCHVPDKYQTFYGYNQARPLNPIRAEIEALKARLNELEAKL